MDLAFFDRTGRGRLIVTGRDNRDLLHRLATMPIEGLAPGRGTATCFCTPKGKLIDWAVVLERGDDVLVLTANPDRLNGHIQQYTITEDVTVRNYMAIEVVVCGLGAKSVLGVDLEPWAFCDRPLAGVTVQVVRIEPLMGDAYAVLAPDAVALRRMLAEKGASLGTEEVDRLRIDAKVPGYPNEINETVNPWEAGLDHSVSLTKGCYVGQEVVARLNTYDKVQRRLVRVRLETDGEAGAALHHDGAEVGALTTVVGDRALAYVKTELAVAGTRLAEGVVE